MDATDNRKTLTEALNLTIREATALGQAYAGAIAAKLGLGAADLDYLEIIGFRGKMTAGELATATGLTTGAVTGIIDRLEKAGVVRRERDPTDRRRVFVIVEAAAHEAAGGHYRDLSEAVDRLTGEYSEAEVALFLDYFTRSRDLMREQIRKLSEARSLLPAAAAESSR